MKKTPDAVRAVALKDPNTRRIAEGVGMDLEQYVDLVVHHATAAQPLEQFFTVPDQALRAAGYDVLEPADVARFFKERQTIDRAVNGTGFDPVKPRGPALR